MTDSPFTSAEESQFEDLLEYLKEARAFDFTTYKRATLRRRVLKRLQTTGIGDVRSYRDYLEVHPDEFRQLFSTILINVTGFFRDPAVWDYVAQSALPTLLRDAPSGEFRVWSAGCASGEEAYTVAMLLAEALGPRALPARREDLRHRRRRRGARRRPPRLVRREADGGRSGRTAREVFRAGQRALRVRPRTAAQRDLRPTRPAAGRADLAGESPHLPQYLHVLQRRSADPHPRAAGLRARARGRTRAREGGDAARMLADPAAHRRQAPRVRQDRAPAARVGPGGRREATGTDRTHAAGSQAARPRARRRPGGAARARRQGHGDVDQRAPPRTVRPGPERRGSAHDRPRGLLPTCGAAIDRRARHETAIWPTSSRTWSGRPPAASRWCSTYT